jgi:hypothetical protein
MQIETSKPADSLLAKSTRTAPIWATQENEFRVAIPSCRNTKWKTANAKYFGLFELSNNSYAFFLFQPLKYKSPPQ